MKPDLFTDLVEPAIHVGTHHWYTLPVSIVSHVLVLAVLVIVPLTANDLFPSPQSVMAFAVPPPAPQPPTRPTPRVAEMPPIDTRPADTNAAPLEAPETLGPEPAPTMRAVANLADPIRTAGTASSALTAPPPPPPIADEQQPVPVGGAVGAPRKTRHVVPVYPSFARSARVEGTVILEATIDRNGVVQNAKVLRSVPMLDQAAIDAVLQWRYTPPTLNDRPVDVTMTVTVQFTLR